MTATKNVIKREKHATRSNINRHDATRRDNGTIAKDDVTTSIIDNATSGSNARTIRKAITKRNKTKT